LPSSTKTMRSPTRFARGPAAARARAAGPCLAPNMPPVSTTVTCAPCHSASAAMMSRVSGDRRDDGPASPGQPIEERGLADVGAVRLSTTGAFSGGCSGWP
jgi:hypothetical protein